MAEQHRMTMVHRHRISGLLLLCCLGLLRFWSIGASAQVRLLSDHRAERPAGLDRGWPAVVTHTHNWRFREGEAAGSFSAAKRQLVRWCEKLGIRAIGVGSAWNPANEANFRRFEGP